MQPEGGGGARHAACMQTQGGAPIALYRQCAEECMAASMPAQMSAACLPGTGEAEAKTVMRNAQRRSEDILAS